MREICITVDSLGHTCVDDRVIGRAGEHRAMSLHFELSADWPGLTDYFRIYFESADKAYITDKLTATGDIIDYVIPQPVLAVSGCLLVQLAGYKIEEDDEEDTITKIIKSDIIRFTVLESVDSSLQLPLDARAPLEQAVAKAETAAKRADDIADELISKLENGDFIGPQGPQGSPGSDALVEPAIAAHNESEDAHPDIRRKQRPNVFAIKCMAGRFNWSWNNATGRKWVFPPGTVLYSDGVTPIISSTDQQPDVIIPAGGGTVYLFSAMWDGNYILHSQQTGAIWIGDVKDIPNLTYYMYLPNASNSTGHINDLPPVQYSLNYPSNWIGDIKDLPVMWGSITVVNNTNLTGNIKDIPKTLAETLSLNYCSNITGDLADLPTLTTYLNLRNTQVYGKYTQVYGNNVPNTDLNGTLLTASDVDNTLIAYAACTKTGGTFSGSGLKRTSASDEAVDHLTKSVGEGGLAWTISGITKI